MRKIKVMSIFGTRPEAIKMAPIVKKMETDERIESIVCVTAQHREMLDQVLDTFKINPQYDLNLMTVGQTLSDITISAIKGLEEIIKKELPDIVLVHGDTTTAFAGALAAYYNKVMIGHVEAGLRTYDKHSPFPEEINRQMIDRVSDFLFAPNETSKNNLLKEGISEDKIYVTGNTIVDALKMTLSNESGNPIFDDLADDRIILLTTHRRENVGEAMYNIFNSVSRVIDEVPNVKVVFPVHKNPRVRAIANEVLNGKENVKMLEPLDVIDFHNLEKRSYIILTDSGGIQEEATYLGKPTLVLRDNTERQEELNTGVIKIIGTDMENIYRNLKKLLEDEVSYAEMANSNSIDDSIIVSDNIIGIIVNKFLDILD